MNRELTRNVSPTDLRRLGDYPGAGLSPYIEKLDLWSKSHFRLQTYKNTMKIVIIPPQKASKSVFKNSLLRGVLTMVQQVKNPALSLQWCRFDPCGLDLIPSPRNIHMPRVWRKKKMLHHNPTISAPNNSAHFFSCHRKMKWTLPQDLDAGDGDCAEYVFHLIQN